MLARFFRASQRALILALGGHDPVVVNNLMYRANNLLTYTDMVVKRRKISPIIEKLINYQIEGIKIHTLRLDPYYGTYVKHYRESRP